LRLVPRNAVRDIRETEVAGFTGQRVRMDVEGR
jgi:hypothetical protein